MKNYYKTLRVNSTATLGEIKHSFRALAHQFHPDKNNGNLYTSEIFVEIKEAYDLLSDGFKRQKYDVEFEKYFPHYYNDYDNTETKSETLNVEEINFIFSELNKFKTADYENIVLEELQKSLKECKEKLTSLKQKQNIKYSSYLDVSSTVVRNAMEIAENLLNDLIKNCLVRPDDLFKKFTPAARTQAVLTWLNDIFKHIITPLENFEMNEVTKEIYLLKKQYYTELKTDFEKKTSQKETGKGCYIATMAYGNYNNYNVLILRYYRDNILETKIFGKQLIKLYYFVSPYLVKVLKDNDIANRVIRSVLNKFVGHIKKRCCLP
jgi:curved DNA-binding protein CbpA